jgi:hypothetical protein
MDVKVPTVYDPVLTSGSIKNPSLYPETVEGVLLVSTG